LNAINHNNSEIWERHYLSILINIAVRYPHPMHVVPW
jgi:hypothetical protein